MGPRHQRGGGGAGLPDNPFGLMRRALSEGGANGFASFSSSSSSWSSGGGPSRAVQTSSSYEIGVRVTRTRETLTHADGRVEIVRDETTRDDGSAAARIEGGRGDARELPRTRALPAPPLPRRAHTFGGVHTHL